MTAASPHQSSFYGQQVIFDFIGKNESPHDFRQSRKKRFAKIGKLINMRFQIGENTYDKYKRRTSGKDERKTSDERRNKW